VGTFKLIRPSDRVEIPKRRFRGGTDPSSAPAIMLRSPMFDVRPHRNRGMPGIARELQALPDDRLIAVMVEHGCPVWSAQELRRSPYLRFCGVRFYFDVEAAAQGDRKAKERVDYLRESYQTMRAVGLIDESPEHTVGLWER
jgi:hypothetical protein